MWTFLSGVFCCLMAAWLFLGRKAAKEEASRLTYLLYRIAMIVVAIFGPLNIVGGIYLLQR